MLGWWMLETLNSPLADFVTASFAVLPSEPGAPDGQSGISAGVCAAASDEDKTSTATIAATFMSFTLSSSK